MTKDSAQVDRDRKPKGGTKEEDGYHKYVRWCYQAESASYYAKGLSSLRSYRNCGKTYYGRSITFREKCEMRNFFRGHLPIIHGIDWTCESSAKNHRHWFDCSDMHMKA